MERDDIITVLLAIGIILIFTDYGDEVYFKSVWFTFVGKPGILLILLAVIVYLQYKKRRRADTL